MTFFNLENGKKNTHCILSPTVEANYLMFLYCGCKVGHKLFVEIQRKKENFLIRPEISEKESV